LVGALVGLGDQVVGWWVGWSVGWLVGWIIGPSVGQRGLLFDWEVNVLACWLDWVGWFGLVGSSDRLTGLLVGWSVGRSVWLVDWLIRWLVGWRAAGWLVGRSVGRVVGWLAALGSRPNNRQSEEGVVLQRLVLALQPCFVQLGHR